MVEEENAGEDSDGANLNQSAAMDVDLDARHAPPQEPFF